MGDHGGTPRNNDGDAAMGALSYVLAGVLFYGALGWLAGRWLHQEWLIAVGLVVGVALSTYLVYKRYGSTK